ncbi:Uncharacterized protein OBRU01_03745 [Operophtera brumata]|uniref:Uncharacterized protein n=1 Tax=Operophtera brumata TaxID=104452 RepID=A0A0L7LQ75_OPEBR|nr:Uncharacterized protein OBRU01_03745 [Operophtera brumata]
MTTSISASTILSNASTIYEGPFHLHSPALGTRVQQLWLMAEILTNNNDDGVIGELATVNLVPESEATNREIVFYKQTCEEVMRLHLGALEYTRYILNINLYGLREFHKRYYIREIVFCFKTYNPAFTQMETCFAPLMDTLFQSTFLAFFMLSWLALYHGLRQNERGFLSFYLIKVIVVGLVVKIMFFCAITLYFLYLLVLIIKAYSDLRNMPFFDIRLRCISLMVATVTFITTILALQGWGPAALQDHWASQPKVHYDTSAPFMALYGLFNFKLNGHYKGQPRVLNDQRFRRRSYLRVGRGKPPPPQLAP